MGVEETKLRAFCGELLREVKALRKLADLHGNCGTGVGRCDDGGHAYDAGCPDIVTVASIWADHPDYAIVVPAELREE
jgi:hypothetical protein